MTKTGFCFSIFLRIPFARPLALLLALLVSFLPITLVRVSAQTLGGSLETEALDENPDPLLTEVSLSLYEWNPGQGGDLQIKLKLPKGFHAYEDTIRLKLVEPEGFKMTAFTLRPVVEFYDKFSKKTRRGVAEESVMSTHLEAPLQFQKAVNNLTFELTYQACSDSVCLFPFTKKISTPIKLLGAPVEPVLESSEGASSPFTRGKNIFSSDYFTEALNKGGLLIFVLAFFAGILTSFTPCIFPMIPITLAVLGNDSQKRTRRQNFVISFVYVTGIATTYSVMGLIAATSGTLFGASLGNIYVLSAVCFVFLAMALSMYGLYDLQMPAWVRNQFGGKVSTGNLHLTTYLTGLFAGLVASPCVGPVLVTILAYVATHQDKILGFFLLFTYALGLGLIFIVLGLSNQLTRFLPRSGKWMNGVKFVLGSLMLTAFYYYLDLLIPPRAFDLALGLGLVSIGGVFGAFQGAKNSFEGLRKGLMLAVLFIGIGYLSFGVFNLRPLVEQRFISETGVEASQKLPWQPYSEELLQKAAQDKMPVIVDFWADWCAACHELEQFTFSDPRVKSLSQKFVLLKFDATKDSEQLRYLKSKYKIQGLPTVIFYNPQGDWLNTLSLTQFEDADNFLKRMNKSLN